MRIEAKVVGRVEIDPSQRVALDHTEVCSADYSGRKLLYFGGVGCRFAGCRFDKTVIECAAFGVGREMSEFVECTFDGARLVGGGGFSRFLRCSFKNVELSNWICFQTELVGCVFSGRMTECIFNGTVPERDRAWVGRERNEFRGNDFSGMDLDDVAFRTGIDLSEQRLPNGHEYLYLPDAAGALGSARAAVKEWHDLGLRQQGLKYIESFDFELEGGQRQLFLRTDNYSVYPPEVLKPVFALLQGG